MTIFPNHTPKGRVCNRKARTFNVIHFSISLIRVHCSELDSLATSWKAWIPESVLKATKQTHCSVLIEKIAIFALKLQINFKRTFECYTVERPVPSSWDREEQMACYLCLGTRSSQILLGTSSAALKGDLKFLNVIQYLWHFLKNQCQWALCSFCTGSDLICT